MSGKELSTETKAKITEDLRGGMTPKSVAARHKVNLSSVYYYRDKLNTKKVKKSSKSKASKPRYQQIAVAAPTPSKLVALIGSPESIREYLRSL